MFQKSIKKRKKLRKNYLFIYYYSTKNITIKYNLN